MMQYRLSPGFALAALLAAATLAPTSATAYLAPTGAERTELVAAAQPKVFVDFGFKRQFRPWTLYLGNQVVRKVRWRRWGKPVTHGKGIFPSNDCEPNCAEGHITNYRAKIRLDRIHACGGILYYSRLRLALPRSAPGSSHQTVSVTCAGRFH